MQIMDEVYLSNPFRLTLAGLYAKPFRSKLASAIRESSPGIVINEKDNSQHAILRYLIPEDYRRNPGGKNIADADKTVISRYFTYYKESKTGKIDALSYYETVKENIIRKARASEYRFEDFELLRHIRTQLESLFEYLPEENREKYREDTAELIGRFEEHDLLAAYKDKLLKMDFYDQLACLTAIAATWAYWDGAGRESSGDVKDLAWILLPSIDGEGGKPGEDEDWKDRYLRSEKERARNLLTDCKEAFGQKMYDRCGKLAEQMIRINFADDIVLGEAYYYLAVCCMEHEYDCGLDVNVILGKAVEYGNSDAYELWRNLGKKTASAGLLSPIAETHGKARIVLNAANQFTEEFLLSVPSEMRRSQDFREMIISASDKKQLQASLDAARDTRYLLFHENPEKNFQDLLYILDKIAAAEEKTEGADFSATLRWSRTTIYIRVSEDEYSALIDTALKRLGDFTVRIFVIDDCKWAAQYLLADYPLYQTIGSLSNNKLIKGPVNIHFTVICGEADALTSRLIREAYWISCFAYPGVKVKINLISPKAGQIRNELRCSCPGMFSELPDADRLSSISVLEDDYTLPSVSDYHVIEHFDSIEAAPNSFNYYVVNLGDDISNLNMGIKLRERSIQNRINAGKNPQSKYLPMIAFYCRNADIAHLSENMVVQLVDHGNRWYNNYNIKPFGMLRERYSWTTLDGGYWEQAAQSTHIQYSGLNKDSSYRDKITALKEYFSRSYNRDSSMAAALSLPYRLFQVPYGEKHHIIPYAHIDNSQTSGENEEVLTSMEEEFKAAMADAVNGAKIRQSLLYYEHSRWVRWAYSRGWRAASPEQVLLYLRAGNPGRQLYIARLHGCLCSVEKLRELSEKMAEELEPADGSLPHQRDWNRFADSREPIRRQQKGDRIFTIGYNYNPFDFTKIDRLNIEATGDILQTRLAPGSGFEEKTK